MSNTKAEERPEPTGLWPLEMVTKCIAVAPSVLLALTEGPDPNCGLKCSVQNGRTYLNPEDVEQWLQQRSIWMNDHRNGVFADGQGLLLIQKAEEEAA